VPRPDDSGVTGASWCSWGANAAGTAFVITLYYPPNHTGGSGVTFTSLIVTPPDETHSHTISEAISIPADSNSAPRITVDPMGAGK
jgi:hypothetical protein